MTIPSLARPAPRPRRDQDPPAGHLGLGRLRPDRRAAPDRRRVALRGRRPARHRPGPRRRGRQRQRLARGGAPLRRRHLDRLRARAPGAGAAARGGRPPADHLPGGRRRGPPVRRRVVRRRPLDLRRHVRARPGAGRERAPARRRAGRQDRPRQLDARGLHRAALRGGERLRAAAGGPALADGVGHARPGWSSSSARTPPTSGRRGRTYTFRYRSAEHWIEFFRTYYGPTHKAFAALDAAGQQALHAALLRLPRRAGTAATAPGSCIPSEYLEVVVTK